MLFVPHTEEELNALATLLGEAPDWRPEAIPADELGLREASFLVEALAGAGVTLHLVEGRLVVRGEVTLNWLAGLAALHGPLMALATEQVEAPCG